MLARVREDHRVHGGLCPGFWALLVHRFGAWRYTVRPRWLRAPFYLLYRVAFTTVQMLTGIEIPCEARIGRRCRIEHHSGIIVNGTAVLGDDVVLRNGVTIGVRRTDAPGSPVIGDRVDIGAGAKLLGAIRIGDDVVIGANAVVLTDVPSGAVAVGVPAVIKRRGGAAPPAGGPQARRGGVDHVAGEGRE